jgi:hypothetical protein
MNEERKKVFEKIKKCLALSASSNEHEAEAALRQARALMEKYGIDHADILAYEACEESVKAGARNKPSSWESRLAAKIADAFDCRLIFVAGWNKGEWTFIGVDAAPEIAGYAFSVLLRQCKRARTAHIDTFLRRCKTATKTRRADLFCDGWVNAVTGKIAAFIGDERAENAIEAYVAKHYPELKDMAPRNRNTGEKLRDHEWDDYVRGGAEGKNAELNRGVDGAAAPLALE